MLDLDSQKENKTELIEEVSVLKRELSTITDQNNALTGEIGELKTQVMNKEQQITDLQENLESKDELLPEFEKQLSDLKDALHNKEAEYEELQGTITTKEQSIADLRENIENKDERLNEFEKQLSDLKDALNLKDEKINEINGLMLEKTDSTAQLEDTLAKTQGELETITGNLEELRTTSNKKDERISHLQNEITDKEKKINELESKVSGLEINFEEITEKYEKVKYLIPEKEQRIKDLEVDVEALNLDLKTNRETLNEITSELEQSKSELIQVQESLNQREIELSEYRARSKTLSYAVTRFLLETTRQTPNKEKLELLLSSEHPVFKIPLALRDIGSATVKSLSRITEHSENEVQSFVDELIHEGMVTMKSGQVFLTGGKLPVKRDKWTQLKLDELMDQCILQISSAASEEEIEKHLDELISILETRVQSPVTYEIRRAREKVRLSDRQELLNRLRVWKERLVKLK